MPILARTASVGARTGSVGQWPVWLLFLVCVALTAGMVTALITLQTKSNHNWEETRALGDASVEANHLSTLEWQSIAAGAVSGPVRSDLDAAGARLDRILSGLTEDNGEDDVWAAYIAFRLGLDKELQALDAGDLQAAREIDEREVDPAFDALDEILEEETASHAARAQAYGTFLNMATILLVMGTSLLIAFLIFKHERSVRALNAALDAKVQARTADLQTANAKLEVLYQDARERAARDSLTGLFNHRSFQEAIRESISAAIEGDGTVGLVVMDVDNFKAINDTIGHQGGDQVLRQVAVALRNCCNGAQLFRQGGDEFAALIQGADGRTASEIADRIRSAICSVESEAALTISLGVAAFPESARTAEELMYGADAAMYWAKASGRNRAQTWGDLLQNKTQGKMPWYAASGSVKAPEVVMALVAALTAKDPATREHVERCSRYTLEIAAAMGIGEEEATVVRMASLLHDIGKIHIRDEVLHKPGPLTEEEWEHMRQHPVIALEILGQIRSVSEASSAILHHHEHYDGSGYPDGLAGDAIPLAARILLVSDAFDAMTSDRPYRKAMSVEAAIEELRRYSGTQFDPVVVEAFLTRLDSLATDHAHEAHSEPPVPALLARGSTNT